MGSSSSRPRHQPSSESRIALYDQRAAAQARVNDTTDFTSPEALVIHLQPGDLIQKKGDYRITEWFYSHWAVYIGNGDIVHVTEVSGSSRKGDIVREDMLDAFCGYNVRKNNHMDEYYLPRRVQDIVRTARRAVGTHWDYNVLTKNCEHFASWCRYGREISLQSFGIFDIMKGNVSFSDYMRYHMKPIKERCQTLFSWVKRKVGLAIEHVTDRMALGW